MEIIVLGDIYTPNSKLDAFVSENLAEMGLEPKFANSTDEFAAMDGYEAPHVLVIGSEWNWMLRDFEKYPVRPSFLFVQISGEVPFGGRKFSVQKLREDGPLFQKHVRAWLKE